MNPFDEVARKPLRDNWYANGCPMDHPYQEVMEAEYAQRPPAFVALIPLDIASSTV